MKSTIHENHQASKYPKLRKMRDTENIYLMITRSSGIMIGLGAGTALGFHNEFLNENDMDDFNGSITLEN